MTFFKDLKASLEEAIYIEQGRKAASRITRLYPVRIPSESSLRALNEAREIENKFSSVGDLTDDLDDVYLAEQTLDRVRQGEERAWSIEEVERDLEDGCRDVDQIIKDLDDDSGRWE